MPSIQAYLIKTYVRLRNLFSPPPRVLDVAKERADLEALAASFKPLGPAQCVPVLAGGVPGEWVIPPEVIEPRVILYLHGGSYVAGSPCTSRPLAVNIARAAHARLLSLDYSLAPEHPVPSGLEDAKAAYRWLLDEGNSPDTIFLAGDSAGGGLALGLLLLLRDEGLPLPVAALCFSPWFDLCLSGETYRSNAGTDVMLDVTSLEHWARLYLGGADPCTPYASPLYGDLHGLPPLLIQVGSDEILLSDAQSLTDKARAAGVDVTLEVWKGMQHEWQFVAKLVPEGRQALGHVSRFVEAQLQAPQPALIPAGNLIQ